MSEGSYTARHSMRSVLEKMLENRGGTEVSEARKAYEWQTAEDVMRGYITEVFRPQEQEILKL